MAAIEIFKLENAYSQGPNAKGICTAIAFNWAYYTLTKGAGLKTKSEIKLNQLALEAQMAVIRKKDGQEEHDSYLELFKLALVKGGNVKNNDDLGKFAKANAPHVVVFWNSHHTMGYRYSHLEKEFFDVEKGLFRAKYTKDVYAKMTEIFNAGGYTDIQHCVAVKLRA